MARKKPTKAAAPAAAAAAPKTEMKMAKVLPGASVGIDFGTSSISVAALRNNTMDIIANDDGERSTPMYVAFTDIEKVLGGPAKELSVRNPTNTVHSVRNFLSQSSTEIAEYLLKGAAFVVVDDSNGNAAFQVVVKGETQVVTPDALITLFAQRLKKYSDDFWDCDVTTAVLSVPVGFSTAAKAALVAAVEAAGFKVAAVISDPVAAALSFNLDAPASMVEKNFGTVATPASALSTSNKTVLVADVGTHTSTITLLRIQDGIITVGASSTSNTVSGQALDDVLYTHFAKAFESSTGAVLEDSPRAVLRLKQGCEQIKRTLAMANQTSIQLDALCEGNDLFTEITRTRFELLSMSVFSAFSKQITDFFSLPNACAADEVTHVCLVGGTANLTKFQTLLQNAIKKVSGHTPVVYKQTIAGDAVAFGAAKQASILAFADLEAANANKVAVNKAIKSGSVAAPTSDAAQCFNAAYNAPQLAMQKGIFVQTFSGAFLPLLPPLSSMPSTHTVCLNIPQNIPATHAAALAFYESAVAAPAQVVKDTAAKRIGVFKVPNQTVAADAGLPVTATIRAVITTEAKLTVDVACSTNNTNALTFVNLFTVDLAAKPVAAATAVPSFPLSNSEKKDAEFRIVLTKLQALVAQWKNWRAYPKHVSFLQKHAHVMPAVNAADATVSSLQALVDLPNPYQPITADKATLESMNQAIKSASAAMDVDQLNEACDKLADDILRVRKTKGLTAAEARTLDRVYAQKAVAVKQVEIVTPEEEEATSDNEVFDIDAGLDFGDFSAGEESDEPESDVDFDFGGDLD